MHQGCRLQCVVGALVTKVRPGTPLELAIDERHEIVPRAHIALCPRLEQAADGVRSFSHATTLPVRLVAGRMNFLIETSCCSVNWEGGNP